MKLPKTEFPPPGFDPTKEAYNLPVDSGPKLSGCLTWVFLAAAIVLVGGKAFFDSVQAKTHAEQQQQTQTHITAAPTRAPDTATPTNSPIPSHTPTGTITLYPTATPTVTPTETMIPPGMMMTWTPGPWVLTRYAKGIPNATKIPTATRTPAGKHTPTARPRR